MTQNIVTGGNNMTNKDDAGKVKTQVTEEDLKKLLNYIGSIQYGSVTLVIQEGRVVQIEKNEKIKLK